MSTPGSRGPSPVKALLYYSMVCFSLPHLPPYFPTSPHSIPSHPSFFLPTSYPSHLTSSQQPTPGGSRPMSPDGIRRGAGSDTDGGAMSDGSRLKLKLKRRGSPSANNSPSTSRAGSPGPRARNLDMGVDPFPTAESALEASFSDSHRHVSRRPASVHRSTLVITS